MALDGERLVWGSLRTNEAFLRDLQRFFDMPTELLKIIADRTKAYPYITLSNEDASELANRFGERAEDLQRVGATLLLFKQRLIDTEQDPIEAVKESRDILDRPELAKGREDDIVDVLSYSQEEREDALAVQAFAGLPAFLSTRINPSLLPVEPDRIKLAGGYLWTVSYLNAEGEQRSITIGLTPGELEQFETTINRAKEQLRMMKNSIDFSQATDS